MVGWTHVQSMIYGVPCKKFIWVVCIKHNYLIYKINDNVAKSLPYRGKVIDLGCGSAPYKEYILKKANEYIGVDWQNCIHNKENINVFCNISNKLPFCDECADTVTAFQVLEHLPEPNLFLSECNRILKHDGCLIITVPFMWHIHEIGRAHV